MGMREQFEKLPEIAIAIKQGIYYNERDNCYSSINGASYLVIARINGAWYAFQEQQNKLNGALDLACKLQYSNGERIYNEIKELLK